MYIEAAANLPLILLTVLLLLWLIRARPEHQFAARTAIFVHILTNMSWLWDVAYRGYEATAEQYAALPESKLAPYFWIFGMGVLSFALLHHISTDDALWDRAHQEVEQKNGGGK